MILKVVLVVLLSASVYGLGPSTYSCDPATCKGACHCPSLSAPGGLTGASVPQFVLVTHDDAISQLANTVVRSALDGFKNPNGCNVVATWFTTSTGTDCDLAKALLDQNHEIALHTVNHKSLLPGMQGMEQEIMGAKEDLAKCGIPKEKMLGFRSPYLIHNPAVRGILKKNNLLYDSSIIEAINSQSDTTNSFAQRLWPYSMDNGIIQNCAWTAPAGQCTPDEKYPGMWEVPLWTLLNDTIDKDNNAYSMDPGPGFGGDVYQTLVTNFDQAYSGNRAPFPLYTHATWFTDENIAATRKFIEYALSKGDVYFVTMQQLIDWMKNPVTAAEYQKKANCNPVNVLPPVKKKCQVYEVQPGDYLDSIAGKFGVLDVRELTSINPSLQVSTIQPGVRVNIPPWDDTCPPSSTIQAITGPEMGEAVTVAVQNTSTPEPTEVAQPQVVQDAVQPTETTAEPCRVWTVASGEFLEGISKATGASVEDITAANTLTTPSLSPGQQLKIPPYPECCNNGGCQPVEPVIQNVPPTRVDVRLNLLGSQSIDANSLEQIKGIIAGELDIPVQAITAQIISRRRGRRLRQATSTPTQIVLSIATTTPVRLGQKVSEELRSGDLESMLGGLGYSMNEMPVIKAYQNGNEVQTEVNPTATTSTTTTNSSSSFWTTGAIIGVAVGGSVALILLITLIVFLIIRHRKKRNADTSTGPARTFSGGMVANVTLRDSHGKRGDPVKVVIGGYDTPTTPRNRVFNQILKTNNPISHSERDTA